MMKPEVSKDIHSQIEKAKSSLILIVAVATVITVFCLVSSKSLLSQGNYQRKVINDRNKATKQLNDDIDAAKKLETYYSNVFQNTGPINIIGGKNDTSPNAVPPDGDNARIVLDALPSSYDFPALVTSLSKILGSRGVASASVSGSDQNSTISNSPTANPQPIEIDVPVSGSVDYEHLLLLLSDLQKSIRPFDITSLQTSGNASNISFTLQMHTYFQPGKTLDVGSKVEK